MAGTQTPPSNEPTKGSTDRGHQSTAIRTPLLTDPRPMQSRNRWWWFVLLLVVGCLFYGGMRFRSHSERCIDGGPAALQRLEAVPETWLIPPDAQIGDRTVRDESCAMNTYYRVAIRLDATTTLPPDALIAFYTQTLQRQGWWREGISDTYRWYKDRYEIELVMRDDPASSRQRQSQPPQTHYQLRIAEPKGPLGHGR